MKQITGNEIDHLRELAKRISDLEDIMIVIRRDAATRYNNLGNSLVKNINEFSEVLADFEERVYNEIEISLAEYVKTWGVTEQMRNLIDTPMKSVGNGTEVFPGHVVE